MSGKIKILIIDDEQVVCDSCERFLSEEGYEVETALNGKEGIGLIEGGDFDIVISDLKMPGVSGMDVLDYVRDNRPDVQVIMITGYSTIANAVESIKKGAADYIPKPFTPDELLSVVRETSIKRMQTRDKIYQYSVKPYQYGLDNIIGASDKMIKIYGLIEKVADTDATVLITGESGTGKELIARAVCNHSGRKDRQFIPVDCSTLAQGLLESELFGHKKGSFTGALRDKRGLFDIADGGTLFLDEVSNIPMDIQSKLLRVIETREYRPVGGEKFKKIDIRLITATNRDLKTMIEKGNFREDLYYRLNVFSIDLPPLRDRPEDIPLLAYHFLRQACRNLDKSIRGFSSDAMQILLKYDWPGNIRELKNAVERMVVMADEDLLSKESLPEVIDRENIDGDSGPTTNEELKRLKQEAREKAVQDVEKNFVLDALARNEWNATRAAEETGMQRSNFQALMKKYNIKGGDIGDYGSAGDSG